MRTLILLAGVAAFVGWAVAADLASTYKGTWSSDDEGSGDLTMIFSHSDSGAVQAQVSFTNEGETTACDVKSVSFDGSKLVLVLDYRGGDNQFEATVSGTLEDKVLNGTYKTKSLNTDSPGDTGTWKVTAVPAEH